MDDGEVPIFEENGIFKPRVGVNVGILEKCRQAFPVVLEGRVPQITHWLGRKFEDIIMKNSENFRRR